MTMLLSAWQDALRRNMAYGDRREERKAAAREQPGMLERATGAVGGALMKIMNPDDPEMARLKLQLQHQAARDAAQRQFQAEAEGREAKRRIEEMRAGHGYKMEEYGAFKPTPEQAHEQKMEWLREQGQYKETPEQRRQRELDVARERARALVNAAGMRQSQGGRGGTWDEGKSAQSAYNAQLSTKRSILGSLAREYAGAITQSQREAVQSRYAPELEEVNANIFSLESRYPHLVGRDRQPAPRPKTTAEFMQPQSQGPAPIALP